VKAEAMGRGRDAYVKVTKTKEYYEFLLKKYQKQSAIWKKWEIFVTKQLGLQNIFIISSSSRSSSSSSTPVVKEESIKCSSSTPKNPKRIKISSDKKLIDLTDD
jgi:hypothetical protein